MIEPVALVGVGVALLAWPRARADPGGRVLGGTRERPARRDRARAPARGTGAGAPGRRAAAGAARREGLTSAVAVAGLGIAIVLLAGLRVGLPTAVVVCPCAMAGLTWIRARPVRLAPDRSLALCLDLAAAVLRSGRPVPEALLAAAPAAQPVVAAALVRVARLLALGAEPHEAWSSVRDATGAVLEPVVVVALRSHASGIRLADSFERLAVEVRAECAAAALARANRAGVRAMGPLAACFLPSFVCLGIVPVVVGVATAALRGAR